MDSLYLLFLLMITTREKSRRFHLFTCNLFVYLFRTSFFVARQQILEICAHFLGLQAAHTEMMGMFVYDLGPVEEEKARENIYFCVCCI